MEEQVFLLDPEAAASHSDEGWFSARTQGKVSISDRFLCGGIQSKRLKTSQSDYLYPKEAIEKQIKLTVSDIQFNQGRQRQFREAVPTLEATLSPRVGAGETQTVQREILVSCREI